SISRFERHVTNINSPRFTEGPISDTINFGPNNVNQTAMLAVSPGSQSRSIPVGQTQQQSEAYVPPPIDENSFTPCTIVTPRDTASDLLATNLHTSNLEFYGSASSVAFLRHVETLSNCQTGPLAGPPERSLTARLHNTDFQPNTSHSIPVAPREDNSNTDRFYFRVARQFLDAYFSNIHYIQPLFEEEVFLARCEDLWFNRRDKQPLSFVALYYATLSLGSLVMTFENPKISGADRFTWSRKLFNDALAIVTRLGTTTDVEMVQCFYMISKICQHELNPHVAYLYSGQAARTSLAIGINRSPVRPDAADPRASAAASKTWCAALRTDRQTSFALGRPDSLGSDQYHTQYLPPAVLEESISSPHVLQIVPCMVDLSRIMRKVALDLYAQPCEMEQKLQRAKALDAELGRWLEQVPPHLRPEQQTESGLSLKSRRLASYIKKQSVVLQLRYLNLRMVTHAVFMTDTKSAESDVASSLRECRCRCIQAAEETIDLMYSTFRTDDYFQTWWYNSTYTLYAVSVLLALVFRQLARTREALENLFAHIDRAIMVLQAMDDCLVARSATAIIKRTLARAKKVPQPALVAYQSLAFQDTGLDDALGPPVYLESEKESDNIDTLPQSQEIESDGLGETVGDLDWLNTYPFDDSQQALFWTEWAHEIDALGT
ncbi:uncharacterized protein A1O5_09602, partial [Cladophialophora psammophila CBS 110553]